MEMIDWNNKTIEQYIEHLEDKFSFDSSSTAKAVYELIAAYRAKNCNKPAVSKCDEPVGEPAVCRNCGAKIDKWQARWGFCDADCMEEHRQTDC